MADDVTDPVEDLLVHLSTEPVAAGRYRGHMPDWFGDRVFGGLLLATSLDAAMRTVDASGVRPHSLHGYFLGPVRPGPVDLTVDRARDGRTFTNREVRLEQDGTTRFAASVSFHEPETGDDYQLPMPDTPAPDSLPDTEDAPPGFEVRWVGPTERRPDGTYRSTRRCWERTTRRLPDDDATHLTVAAFLSDMTGTSFRPHSLGVWGTHTDASIDHAVWFHRPLRVDEWIYADFHALVSTAGRSTVRGELYDQAGNLCLSMAQELLIRPLESGS